MNGYIIYKFNDESIVKKELKQLQSLCGNLEPLMLPKQPIKHWKSYAYKKIKCADCAIFFVGEKCCESKNIDWELKQFKKLGKPIYTLKLSDNVQYNRLLYRTNTFGNLELIDKSGYMYSREVSLDKLAMIINNNLELDISSDIICNSNMSDDIIIEQYKAYLQTSEDVISRRQSVSNFYVTVNSTLITILSAVVALINGLGKDYSLLITVISCYFVPILGILLCLNWRRLIYSYGQLNAAKMKVISALEKKLPFNIYDVEWKVQTDKLGKRKYISFTNIEKLIPMIFVFIYVAIFIAAVVLTVVLSVSPQNNREEIELTSSASQAMMDSFGMLLVSSHLL